MTLFQKFDILTIMLIFFHVYFSDAKFSERYSYGEHQKLLNSPIKYILNIDNLRLTK